MGFTVKGHDQGHGMFGNGTGEAGGCDVHNPHYDFNDAAIPYGGGMLATIIRHSFKGDLYPVNPSAENVQGLKC